MLDEQHSAMGGDDQDTVQAQVGSVMLGNPIRRPQKRGREVHIAERHRHQIARRCR